MKAYKFRAASQMQFALDIILNRRLFCSDWKNLNDPMEGMFAFSSRGHDPAVQSRVKGIGNAKQRYKICSLSSDFQSHLLWSHYAGGFDGMAIEINLPADDSRVRPVEYRGVFAFLDMASVHDESEAARRILFSKYQEWSYEREIRILNESSFYQLESPVSQVIVGPRMHEALQEALYIICKRQKIRFSRAGIGDEGIDADTVDPTSFARTRRHPRCS